MQTYKTSHNDLLPYKNSQNNNNNTNNNTNNNNNNTNNNNRLTHNLVCGIVGLSISPSEDHGSVEVQLQVYSS